VTLPVPRLSIGLPVYNGEHHLEATLDSLLAQTWSDFEILISDNASTDGTAAIAKRFVAAHPRVHYRRQSHNIGLSGNYNSVFALGRGELFKWATADDLCLPGYLAACVAALDAEPGAVLAYPRTRFVDAEGRELPKHDQGWDLRSPSPAQRLRYVLASAHWVNSIVGVIRRSALVRTRLMPDYPSGDYRLLAELSLLGTFIEVPEMLYIRRLHADSSSQHMRDTVWMTAYIRGRGGSIALPYASLLRDEARIIRDSELSLGSKASLLAFLARTLWWRRGRLARELLTAASVYWRGQTQMVE